MIYDEVNNDKNKNLIAIVCVGYNRLEGLQRLIGSLLKADYPNGVNVPLIISIDASNDETLYEYVKGVQWPFGDKYVNIQEERLGLKEHLFQCAGLSKYFKGIIVLEDDIFVSPSFYHYSLSSVKTYGNQNNIMGIALYAHEMNGFVGLPFSPMKTRSDVYLLQEVCSWGEIFTYNMWKQFLSWYESQSDIEQIISKEDLPPMIKKWTRAWSKFVYAYMLEKNKYFVFPYDSYTTNFSDTGEHGKATNSVQVCMQWGIKKDYIFPSADDIVIYDSFRNNVKIYKFLELNKKELCIDLYNAQRNRTDKQFLLSTKALPYKIIKSWGLRLRPIEINIFESIKGDSIRLYDTKINSDKIKNDFYSYVDYYLKGFNIRYLRKFCIINFVLTLKRKIFRKD